MLFLKRDLYVGRSLEAYGEFSEAESAVFVQLLRPGDIVIEAGANIGAHTVHIAKLVGASGIVFAFEPQRIIFQLLCANLALNEVHNVHAIHAAVGREMGKTNVPLQDYAVEQNFAGIAMRDSGAGEDIGVFKLDNLLLPSLRLLKVDVEGMEIDVLIGARELIRRYRPVLYVENDRQAHSEEMITLIDALSYNMWWHLPALFNPANFAGNATNLFPNVISVNLLCFPKEMRRTVSGLRAVSGPKDWWQA